jgi:hypothetical protein
VIHISAVESMNSKTAALLFTILGVGGMLLLGLTLAPTASAYIVDEDEEEEVIQLALELAENVDEDDEEEGEDNRIICIEVEPGLIECFDV